MDALKYISQSRAQLMAFAILGVLFVHSGIRVPNGMLDFTIQTGYGGVDLFFFLSGFGLFYSCKKDGRCLNFWLKRLKRIMPAYVVCILISQLMTRGRINWTHLWQDCLFVGYWIPQLKWHFFAWFMSGIMGLYLVFPLFYKAFRRYPAGATLHGALAGLFFAGVYSYYFLILHPNGCNAFIHLFARTPLFFLGTYFAYLYDKEKSGTFQISSTLLLTLLVLPFVGYKVFGVVTNMGLNYNQLRNSGCSFYPFLLIVPGASIAAGYILCHCPRIARRILGWIGNSTLEAYLLLGAVFSFQNKFIALAGGSDIAGRLIMIAACIVIACLLHYAIQYAGKGISKLKEKGLVTTLRLS